MPDPNWTSQYDFSKTPEANGFTRSIHGAPVLMLATSGAPANRRVEINSDAGDIVFLTSQVPSLSESLGATAEAVVSVTGGDAGFQLTFLTCAILVQVHPDKLYVGMPGDPPGGYVNIDIPIVNSGNVTVRATFSPGRLLRLYRNGVLVGGPYTVPNRSQAYQEVQWWGEGGFQVWRFMAYYLGGAVAP